MHYQKFGVIEAMATTVTLQFDDRSITYSKGRIVNIMVQVDKFIFPC